MPHRLFCWESPEAQEALASSRFRRGACRGHRPPSSSSAALQKPACAAGRVLPRGRRSARGTAAPAPVLTRRPAAAVPPPRSSAGVAPGRLPSARSAPLDRRGRGAVPEPPSPPGLRPPSSLGSGGRGPWGSWAGPAGTDGRCLPQLAPCASEPACAASARGRRGAAAALTGWGRPGGNCGVITRRRCRRRPRLAAVTGERREHGGEHS